VPTCSPTHLYHARAKTRAVGKYFLRADVTRCYASIYTHSIPWALKGKAWAKTNRRGSAGNELDLAIRNGQDQQTLGIPIGPDWSFAIAESVLTAVDNLLTSRINSLSANRFYDDYELAFPTYNEALGAMGILQEALSEYELALNPTKTGLRNCQWRMRCRGSMS
jgi:Reverse transcriptase (RNA-dependent DNA polymerase)